MKTELCVRVEEEMALVLSGDAPDEVYDHLAECADCRDLRHDAERHADAVKSAGSDFAMPGDFEARILATLDTRAKDAKPAATGDVATAGAIAASSVGPEKLSGTENTAAKELSDVIARRAKEGVRSQSADASGKRFTMLASGGAALLLAAGVTMAVLSDQAPPSLLSGGSWSGAVTRVTGPGFEVCDAQRANCAPAKEGTSISEGSILRTDAKTRANIKLNDGSLIGIDRDSELAFRKGNGRSAELIRGVLVADIAHLSSQSDPTDRVAVGSEKVAQALFKVPGGEVRVLGTKFELIADKNETRVNVTRGAVEIDGKGGREVVRLGEEGLLGERTVRVFPSLRVPELLLSDERSKNPSDGEVAIRGLGELRAKKPGTQNERIGAVHLSKHDVHVKISDAIARTEIDETFANDTAEELEGLYRFPLPADAQIERLALEVNGKLEEAAFVEKDKAAAIWRGVIQHAVPTAPKPKEEIIWVPGPWRDPALLEWKRGGRFELRIFPIPAKGSRRIVLSYTQTVPQTGGARHYTYPLPQAGVGLTQVDSASFDVRVVGFDEAAGVRAKGYPMNSTREGNAEVLRFGQSGFLPSGDLSVTFAPKTRDSEVSAWSYQPPASTGDASPYVAFALRPNLPRARSTGYRDHVLVVDTSRSMVGERLSQARRVVESAIEEMDSRDRVTVLACDSTCTELAGGLTSVSGDVKDRSKKFLSGITADGSANILQMMQTVNQRYVSGRTASSQDDDRTTHVVYIGDGSASSGPILPRHLAGEVVKMFGNGRATVDAVAVGQDADTRLLSALTNAGGGSTVSFVPGETAHEVGAKVVLLASGAALKQTQLVLPEGLSMVAPADVGTMRAGSETWVVARMTRPMVDGEMILKGNVGGESFERKFPLHVVASEDAGNAFVPRLYASVRMQELERSGGWNAKPEMIELSKKFNLASPYTSLLVLESEAMFNAFGLTHTNSMPEWTGDNAAEKSTAGDDVENLQGAAKDSEGKLGLDESSKKPDLASNTAMTTSQPSGEGFGSSGGGAMGRVAEAKPMATAVPPAPMAAKASGDRDAYDKKSEERKMASLGHAGPRTHNEGEPLQMDEAAPSRSRAAVVPPADIPVNDPWNRRSPRMIPMRRIWERKGDVYADPSRVHNATLLLAAENRALQSPDSRDAARGLFAQVMRQGSLDRARDIAENWASRDALDTDALVARADVLARAGNRPEAIRVLGGIVDLKSDNADSQNRLADLFARQGNLAQSCAHRIALAEEKNSDVDNVARAVLCSRNVGMTDLAQKLSTDLPAEKQSALSSALMKVQVLPDSSASGDVSVSANWSGSDDVDVALIDAQGVRISWLGGRSGISVQNPTGLGRETLSFRGLKAGSYLVEVTRHGSGGGFVSGTVDMSSVGQRRSVPFSLSGNRAEVGVIEVSYQSRLVEAWDTVNSPPVSPRPIAPIQRPTDRNPLPFRD